MKVVLHIDSDKENRLNLALNNMKNLLTATEGQVVEGAVVVNGPGANQVTKNMEPGLAEMVDSLSAEGIDFFVCNNSLIKFEIGKEELHTAFKIVGAGILKLVELQEEGFAYVKP